MSLNLFDIPGLDYRYKAKRWVPFKPANTGRQPILFTVPACDDYYDLKETKLEIKVRLNTSGTNGVSAATGAASDGNNSKYIYCVNNFGHTLFNQMNVSFNGVLMTEQSNAYHQKAYLETIQNYNRQEGETLLAPQGWVNELNVVDHLTPTNAQTDDEPDDANWAGKTALVSLTSKLLGKAFHTFYIKPHIAVFKTGKCLVPNVQIDLELYLNDNSIFLFGTSDTGTTVNKKIPKLEDGDIFVTLWMKKITLHANVYDKLVRERSLGKGRNVVYPVVRSEIRTFSFDGRSIEWTQDNVFLNKVPIKVIIGLMNSTNYNWDLQKYPFAYEKFGVTRVEQRIDGEVYPYRTMEVVGNTKARDFVGYDQWLEATGAYTHHKPTMLLPGDWGQGNNCTLYMFNNVPGDSEDPMWRNLKMTGNVSYTIKFRANVGHNVTIVIWSEYENHYEIDKFGGILYSINS